MSFSPTLLLKVVILFQVGFFCSVDFAVSAHKSFKSNCPGVDSRTKQNETDQKHEVLFYSVRLEGGRVSENMVKFFDYLYKNSLLRCWLINIPYSESLRKAYADLWQEMGISNPPLWREIVGMPFEDVLNLHGDKGEYTDEEKERWQDYLQNREKRHAIYLEKILAEKQILPAGYPKKQMDRLLCKLNSSKCDDEGKLLPYYPGDTFHVPGVFFRPYESYELASLSADEHMPDDLIPVLTRLGVISEQTDSEERELIVKRVKKKNLNFQFPFQRQKGKLRIPFIYAPRTAYFTRLPLPVDDISKNADLKRLRETGHFFVKPYSEKYPIRTQSLSEEDKILANKNRRVLEKHIEDLKIAVSLPESSSGPASEEPVIVIGDQGFDPDSKFSSDDLSGLSEDEIYQAILSYHSCDKKKSHGIHLKGIITGNIPKIWTGVAPRSKVIDWDFQRKRMSGEDLFEYLNSDDALDDDVDIVNLSFDIKNKEIVAVQGDAIAIFNNTLTKSPGILYVVAAGNGYPKYKLRKDSLPIPVIGYRHQNAMVVGALDRTGETLLSSSNRGRDIVHIAAPGEKILSLCDDNTVGVLTGTSQATAIVSGAAAVLMEHGLTVPWIVKMRLMYTSDPLLSLGPDILSGRINIKRALNAETDKVCPVKNLSDDGRGNCGVDKNNPEGQGWRLGPTHFRFEGTKEKVKKVKIFPEVGKNESIPVYKLLRITGSPEKKYTVFSYDLGKSPILQKYQNVKKIKGIDKTGKPGKKELEIYSDSWGKMPIRKIGDWVRAVSRLKKQFAVVNTD